MNAEPLSENCLMFPNVSAAVDRRGQTDQAECYAGARFARGMMLAVGLCAPFWMLAIYGLHHFLGR
jgi:hypothetical protein